LTTSDKPHASSIERTFAILEMLDKSRRGWNISEMSRKLKIPKSSAHVIVLTLERLGYVKRIGNSRNYQLGLKIYGLGRSLMRDLPLPEIALPHLKWLVEQTSLTAHLGVIEKNKVVFVQKVDGGGMIKFDTYVGKAADIHCTGLGKALLANLPEQPLSDILSGEAFTHYTKMTITDPAGLREELSRVRSEGYSVDDEEEELGVRCIAAPVLNPSGEVIAAVSVTGTTFQIRPEFFKQIGATVKQASSRISRALQRST